MLIMNKNNAIADTISWSSSTGQSLESLNVDKVEIDQVDHVYDDYKYPKMINHNSIVDLTSWNSL